MLVGDEPERPYERPPLSKDYLRGEAERDKVFVHDAAFYDEHDIELRPGVRRRRRSTRRSRRSRWPTASVSPRTGCCSPPAPSRAGWTSPAPTWTASCTCAPWPTAARLREALDAGRAGSWSSARAGSARRPPPRRAQLGRRGHRARAVAVPLQRVLGPEVGRLFADLHREHGVELLTGAGLEAIEGAGRVERVRLADGRTIDCAAVARRRRRGAAHGARRGRGSRGRQRHPRRRAPADERPRTSTPPATSPTPRTRSTAAAARRALGQRPQPGAGGRAQHARARRGLRPHPLLLLRPVRRRHGVLGAGAAAPTRWCCAATSRAGS